MGLKFVRGRGSGCVVCVLACLLHGFLSVRERGNLRVSDQWWCGRWRTAERPVFGGLFRPEGSCW